MNSPDKRHRFWSERYAEDRTPWDLGEVSRPVRELVDAAFPAAGEVFIPGCGRGHEALFLAGRGYAVTALDYVAAPLEHLRRVALARDLKMEIVQADAFALPENHAGRYDVFLEQTFLCAIPPARWPAYEALACRVLKPGGRLLGVFMVVAVESPPPYHTPPEVVQGLFPADRWEYEGMRWVEPQIPERPGPEFTAGWRKR